MVLGDAFFIAFHSQFYVLIKNTFINDLKTVDFGKRELIIFYFELLFYA